MVEELGLKTMPGTAIDWIEVRQAYEGHETLARICARYGLTDAQLKWRRHREGWRPRGNKAPSRPAMIARMLVVLEQQIVVLEKRGKSLPADERGSRMHEKQNERDVQLLNTMTRTLEKLMELEMRERGRRAQKASNADPDRLREKLVQRIEELGRR